MNLHLTKKDLINFEEEIADLFNKGQIKFPIHLSGSIDGIQEEFLLNLFKQIHPEDWVLSTWRNHWHYLLYKHNPEKLKQMIQTTGSMNIYDDHFFTSAIVGGIAPIALGLAYALKLKQSDRKVWCFCGDMAGTGGLFMECVRFSCGYDLPITYIIECNNYSVQTNVRESWGCNNCLENCYYYSPKKEKVVVYNYKRLYAHAGTKKENSGIYNPF